MPCLRDITEGLLHAVTPTLMHGRGAEEKGCNVAGP